MLVRLGPIILLSASPLRIFRHFTSGWKHWVRVPPARVASRYFARPKLAIVPDTTGNRHNGNMSRLEAIAWHILDSGWSLNGKSPCLLLFLVIGRRSRSNGFNSSQSWLAGIEIPQPVNISQSCAIPWQWLLFLSSLMMQLWRCSTFSRPVRLAMTLFTTVFDNAADLSTMSLLPAKIHALLFKEFCWSYS